MKRFAKRLLWAVLAVMLGWMTMGIRLRRSVKAVWKDTPLSHRTSYSAAIRAEAISQVEQIGKSGRSRDLAAWLAEVAAEKSVERLLADVDAARTMPAGWRIFATRIALERLADVDAAAALDFALLRLGDPSAGWTALANALRLRAAGNPEQLRPFLLAAAIQLCNGSGGVAEMARLRPRECLDAILRLHLPLHLSGVSEAFNACAGANPLAVLEARPDLAPDVRRQFLLNWSFTDPAAALAWMQAHPADADEQTERSATVGAAVLLGRIDGLAGMAPDDKAALIGQIGLMRPDVAAQALAAMPENERAALAGRLIPQRVEPGAGAHVLKWIESLPPDLRVSPHIEIPSPIPADELSRWLALDVVSDTLASQIASETRRDPAANRQWFEALPPAAQSSALAGVVAGLAQNDPLQAAEILSTQRRGARWNEAVLSLAEAWGDFDPAGVKNWIATLPPGTAREAAKAAGIRP